MKYAVVLCASLILTAASVGAADVDDAVALVKRTLPLTQQMNWQAYAEHVHPEALANYSEEMRPVFEGLQAMIDQDSTQIQYLELNYPGLSELVIKANDAPTEEFFAASMNLIFSLVPGSTEMFSSLESEVVGGLPEGDSLVHVVTRSRISTGGLTVDNQMDVVTCKLYEDEYKILLSAELTGLAQGLKQGMGM